MKVKRIVHSILCFVLCCCILLHSMPVKADATAAGAAAVITGAAGVSVAAPLAIGASLIALGVMAKNTNPLVFENTVNDAVASLSAAGTWVKDGAVELLQTIDEAGQKAYYVAGDMFEDLRTWVFDASIVSSTVISSGESFSYTNFEGTVISSPVPFQIIRFHYEGKYNGVYAELYFSSGNYAFYIDGVSYGSSVYVNDVRYSYLTESCADSQLDIYPSIAVGSIAVDRMSSSSDYATYLIERYASGEFDDSFSTSYDLTLGSIPYAGAFTGGTVTDNTFLDFLSKRIRFQNSTDPDNDGSNEDNYSWMVPLALGAAGTVYAMTQLEQWTGQTSADFEDYNVIDEMTIVSTPTVGGYPGILTTPKVDIGTDDDVVVPPAIGGGSITITPAEGLEGTLTETKAQTFLDSIGAFFAGWLDAILQWLEALWELISSGVITLVDAIKALPAAIADAISSVLTKLFAISDTFIATKVEALTLKYPYLDTFRAFGANLKGYLSGIGSTPPVIYINLGAASGSYEYGGTMPFLDLTWYSQYKPTMDAILGGFLWLWLAWRLYLAAPGIISGASGTWGSIASLRERRKEDKE